MKVPQVFLYLLGLITLAHALALPSSSDSLADASKELFKRKGGGGGKGGGGTSSGSSGSTGSSGSGSGGRGSGSGSSGSTSSGSSVRPSYAGGRYAGGATSAYPAGRGVPGGIAPYFLAGSALAFFPGVWLYGAYAYPYGHPYTYHNDTSGQNETRPVECLCGQYQQCGCDNSGNDTSYLDGVANNNSVARVANVNGTDTLVVNGTLPNGTDASSTSGANGLGQGLAEMSGLWIVVAGVVYTMWLM